jgi:hypothetical protein
MPAARWHRTRIARASGAAFGRNGHLFGRPHFSSAADLVLDGFRRSVLMVDLESLLLALQQRMREHRLRALPIVLER